MTKYNEEHVLLFKIPEAEAGKYYIDIAKAMSEVSRVGHEQLGMWHVHAACTYFDIQKTGSHANDRIGLQYEVALSGIPRNYVGINSIKMCFEEWKDQQQKVYESMGNDSFKPKWQDFKIWLNEDHKNTGDLIPYMGHMFGAHQQIIAGAVDSWERSTFVIEEAMSAGGTITEHIPSIWALGPNDGFDFYGIIQNYGLNRAKETIPDPAVPTGASTNLYAMAENALADQDAQLKAEMMTSGLRNPPYDNDNYVGGAAYATATNGIPYLFAFGTNSSTAKKKLTLNGFAAPNGLIECQFQANNFNTPGVDGTGEFWIQLFVSHKEAY